MLCRSFYTWFESRVICKTSSKTSFFSTSFSSQFFFFAWFVSINFNHSDNVISQNRHRIDDRTSAFKQQQHESTMIQNRKKSKCECNIYRICSQVHRCVCASNKMNMPSISYCSFNSHLPFISFHFIRIFIVAVAVVCV